MQDPRPAAGFCRPSLGLSTLFAAVGGQELDELRNHILASCLSYIMQSDIGTPSKRDRITALLSTFHTGDLNLAVLKHKIAVNYGGFADPDGVMAIVNPLILDNITLPSYTNQRFAFDDLERALDLALLYEEAHGNRQIRDFCSQMLTRFKWIKQREEFGFLRVSPEHVADHESDPVRYVEQLLGMV